MGILFNVLIFLLMLVSLCYSQDDNVDRTVVNTDTTDEKDTSSNSVVVLGVTLSLTVIFAVAGIFIGVYFRVERLLCCCRRNKENKETSSLSKHEFWYGSERMATGGGIENQSFETNEVEIQKKSKPRRNPILPKRRNPKSVKPLSDIQCPAAFTTSTTDVLQDGTILKSTGDKADKINCNSTTELSYGAHANAKDDILF